MGHAIKIKSTRTKASWGKLKNYALLHRRLQTAFKQDLLSAFKLATDAENTPVDTGMAVNSMLPAMQALGYRGSSLGGSGIKKGYWPIAAQYSKDIYQADEWKSAHDGAMLGRHAFTLDLGHARRMQYSFTFDTVVGHWYWRDVGIFHGGPFKTLPVLMTEFKKLWAISSRTIPRKFVREAIKTHTTETKVI